MADLFYDETQLAEGAYARVLLTGDPKTGKTTSVLCTAPGPIAVLNCDGPGAPMAAKRHGAKDLKILDVDCADRWLKGVDASIKLAKAGEVRTVVVDTITHLVNVVLELEMSRRYQGFDIWKNVYNKTIDGLAALKDELDAHLVVCSHFSVKDGVIPLDGKMKSVLPGFTHDIIHLDYSDKNDPPRQYIMGPSASGLAGSRRIDKGMMIPADFSQALEILGYAL